MSSQDKTPPSGASRRKYSRPVLRTYGTIRAITRNTKSMNPQSDGPGMSAKT